MIDLSRLRALVFDIDGVLTDARVLASPEGELLRTLSIRDGYALKRALQVGLRVGLITGGKSEGARKRFAQLGITDYYSGVIEKGSVLTAYLERHNIVAEDCLYMGDDIPDLAPMRIAGISCAPADACAEVLAEADIITAAPGGSHCVREVIEQVLKAQSVWLPA